MSSSGLKVPKQQLVTTSKSRLCSSKWQIQKICHGKCPLVALNCKSTLLFCTSGIGSMNMLTWPRPLPPHRDLLGSGQVRCGIGHKTTEYLSPCWGPVHKLTGLASWVCDITKSVFFRLAVIGQSQYRGLKVLHWHIRVCVTEPLRSEYLAWVLTAYLFKLCLFFYRIKGTRGPVNMFNNWIFTRGGEL